MEHIGSISCSECGSPVGTSSGRCPFCGAELSRARGTSRKSEAAVVGYSEGALRYKKEKAKASTSKDRVGLFSKPVVALVAVASVLVLAGAVISFIRSRTTAEVESPPPPPPPPRLPPGEVRVETPSLFSPDDAIVAAQHRAREFSPNARLLSIIAGPVIDTFVDLTRDDAQVAFTYFATDEDPARTPPTKGRRFVVTISKEGTMQADFPPAPSDAKAVVEEPLCAFSAAIRAGRASGIPDDAAIQAIYELDTTLRRAIWTLSVPDQKELTRYVDGKTCAIVAVRR